MNIYYIYGHFNSISWSNLSLI